jgi:hypothetical protein
MSFRPVHRRLTAWLAALALMLGSLLPVLSHAVVVAPSGGQGWVEVCTVSGMAWVKQVSDDAGAASDSQHSMPGSDASMDRCGWCATHSPMAGLPPVAGPLLGPIAFAADVPAAFLHAPRPLFVWASAHSRAPPATV